MWISIDKSKSIKNDAILFVTHKKRDVTRSRSKESRCTLCHGIGLCSDRDTREGHIFNIFAVGLNVVVAYLSNTE